MTSPQAPCQQSLVRTDGHDLHASVGQECQVSMDIVGVAPIDPHELIEDLGGVGCRQHGRRSQESRDLIGTAFGP
jgi:hypothetical protein